jgi:hypothetical protein
MNSCWKNTPEEIVNYILKLARGRLVYRENRYIEIGKIKETECIKKFDCINKFLRKNYLLKSEIRFVGNINRSWCLQFQFDFDFNGNSYDKDFIKLHGLSFDYLENNNFEICYFLYRVQKSVPSLTSPWTRIRTIIN